jgi:hypothetical protein
MAKVALHQGEAKLLPFRIVDKRTGKTLDLTGATFLLWVKRSPADTTPIFSKADADFNKASAASGFVTVFVTAHDTYRPPWIYKAELRVTKAGSPVPIEKLAFDLEIVKSITPNDWILEPTGIVSLEALGAPVATQ